MTPKSAPTGNRTPASKKGLRDTHRPEMYLEPKWLRYLYKDFLTPNNNYKSESQIYNFYYVLENLNISTVAILAQGTSRADANLAGLFCSRGFESHSYHFFLPNAIIFSKAVKLRKRPKNTSSALLTMPKTLFGKHFFPFWDPYKSLKNHLALS